MANIASSAEILEHLHAEFLPASDSLDTGSSQKAEVGRSFRHYFQEFPVFLREQVGDGPDAPTMDALSAIARNASDRQRMIDAMRATVADILQPVSAGFVLGLNRYLQDDVRFAEFRDSFYQRLMELRNTQFDGIDESKSPEEIALVKKTRNQETSLSFGCSNVAHTTFSQLDLLPRVFHAQYGRLPDAMEFQGMVSSLPPLMHILATAHDEIHEILIDVMRGTQWFFDSESPCYWAPYQPEAFRLDGLRLELHPDIIGPARRMIRAAIKEGTFKTDQPRVGCPAARIIPSLHQWCLKTARPVFLENMDALMRLQDDRRMEVALENTGDWSRFL